MGNVAGLTSDIYTVYAEDNIGSKEWIREEHSKAWRVDVTYGSTGEVQGESAEECRGWWGEWWAAGFRDAAY